MLCCFGPYLPFSSPMRPEQKAKAFQKAHELSKKTGVARAVKAVGVSRYGYYKWLDRNNLKHISRSKRFKNDQGKEEDDQEETDNLRV